MKHNHLPSVTWKYLIRRTIARLALLTMCTGIFALVLALYRVPAEPALYAGALCLVPLLVITAVSFYKQRARHRTICLLLNGLPDTLQHLPSAGSQLEENYQSLLHEMARLYARRVGDDDLRYTQMKEYYTLWSHQVKTPLAAMRLLLSRQDDERGRLLLSELHKVEHYVDMALNYMRLDSPDSDYRFEQVPLRDAAQAAARRYAGQFVLKRLNLLNEVPESACAISDRKWLVFVLEQLLSNAVKYTHAGGVRITWDEGTQMLAVQDTGVGIAPDDLPRVFEQGFTGYTGRIEQQATGIGLYLCRKACVRLGHDLHLTSAPEQGTTAAITFAPPARHPA